MFTNWTTGIVFRQVISEAKKLAIFPQTNGSVFEIFHTVGSKI